MNKSDRIKKVIKRVEKRISDNILLIEMLAIDCMSNITYPKLVDINDSKIKRYQRANDKYRRYLKQCAEMLAEELS